MTAAPSWYLFINRICGFIAVKLSSLTNQIKLMHRVANEIPLNVSKYFDQIKSFDHAHILDKSIYATISSKYSSKDCIMDTCSVFDRHTNRKQFLWIQII